MPARPLALPQPDAPGVFLFSDEIIRAITDEEKRDLKYTAARCPDALKQSIVQLLKEDRPLAWIADLLHCHHETVAAILDDPECALDIDAGRRALIAPKCRRVILKELQRLDNCPGILPASSIPLAVKMLYDVQALEDGKPTSISENRQTKGNIFEQFADFVEGLKKEMDAENQAPEIGLPAGKVSVIEGEFADDPALPDGEAGPETPARTDCESEHSGQFTHGNENDVPTFDTDFESDSAAILLGIQTPGQSQTDTRGGDAQAEGRGRASTDNGAQNFRPNGSEEIGGS